MTSAFGVVHKSLPRAARELVRAGKGGKKLQLRAFQQEAGHLAAKIHGISTKPKPKVVDLRGTRAKA